jgi:hypothetical protein
MKFRAALIFVAVASISMATEQCKKEGQRRPGMWTYFWYSEDAAKSQCIDDKGQLVTYTRVTTNSRNNNPDVKLVAQFPPIPVPDIAYFWYQQPETDERNEPLRCIEINGRLRRFTLITITRGQISTLANSCACKH